MDPKIIFEDNNLAVVYKPAGVVVNRADTTRNMMTLQDWIDSQFRVQSSEFRVEDKEKYVVDGYDKYEEFLDRSGIVHRLDKETSGIILVAKNVEAFINLQNQFKSGEVEKKYVALVHGMIESDGEINEPIGRLPWNRTKFGVLPEGRTAKTLYKVLAHKKLRDEALTLLELSPKTGRTHQIRVHLKHLGFPIFADVLYAGRKKSRVDRKLLRRHFLHASEISFINPKTGERISFESLLPVDLKEFLETLEKV